MMMMMMMMMCVCQLLVEHVDVIAPDPHDILHELLDDLGEVQDVDFLIGIYTTHTLCLSLSLCVLLQLNYCSLYYYVNKYGIVASL